MSAGRRIGAAFLSWAMATFAAEPPAPHRLLFFEYGKGPNQMVELDVKGGVVWEHIPPSLAVIFQVVWKWADHSLVKSLTTVRVLED